MPKFVAGYRPPKSYARFNGDGTVTLVGKAWKDNYPKQKENSTMAGILVQSAVKQIIKDAGKKSGSDFMQTLNDFVEQKVKEAAQAHNGGRKILDAGVAKLVLGIKS